MNPPRFYLQRIELSNYRCFKHLTVDFDERLTVLIARNGLGKTAVLDAISKALEQFVAGFGKSTKTSIQISDVLMRLTNPSLREMEPQYPCWIEASAYSEPLKVTDQVAQRIIDISNKSECIWKLVRNPPNTKITTLNLSSDSLFNKVKRVHNNRCDDVITKANFMRELVSQGEPIDLPLVAYYGTGRLWKQKKKPENKALNNEFFSRTSGYQDCLDPASSFKYVADWLSYATYADIQERDQRRQKEGQAYMDRDTAFTPLLSAVRLAVDECLKISGWQGLRYSLTHQTVVMEHPDYGVLEVSQLSDGVRNMIGLVADIAYRTVRLNSRFGQEAPKQTPGLVLIDEVDMHLHPEWQQVVLINLTKAFPALQFIVTTHSPQVLTTVKREQIRLLSENIEGEAVAAIPTGNTYGRSNADVLQSVMAVSPEPKVPESQELRDYLALVEQGDWRSNRAGLLRQQLEQVLGADYPWLIRADMIMRRREALER